MAALRQIAFYGKGGTGKPKRKAQAPIEDRSLGSPSKNEMHFHGRMNVMASMRGGEGFRVPPAASRKAMQRRSEGQPPMPKNALILIEGSKMGTGQMYVQAAKGLGLHPITLSADPARYDYLATENNDAIRVDTDDLDALIRECSRLREIYHIAGITGFPNPGEAVYATVAKLCRHFGLPGPNPESIERCCDKSAQRQLLAEAGVPVPAYRMATNAAEIEMAAAEIGLPVILKPAVGNGSTGVRLCRGAEELAEHMVYLLGGTYEWQTSPRILVEEFAQGPYFVADIMGNTIIEIGAGDFGPPPNFVYREYTYPAPLTDYQRARIADVSLSCLRALDLRWGPTNIEFRWTERGPVVIEVNPRLACSPDPQLIQLANGVDLVTEHIKLVIGNEFTQKALADCDRPVPGSRSRWHPRPYRGRRSGG